MNEDTATIIVARDYAFVTSNVITEDGGMATLVIWVKGPADLNAPVGDDGRVNLFNTSAKPAMVAITIPYSIDFVQDLINWLDQHPEVM